MAQLDAPKHLLLVNSNLDSLSTLKELLAQKTQYRIVTATDAQSAIKQLRVQDIHFVVSNIQLAEFDGWRLARLVRSGIFRCAPNIPFVIVANTWCEHIAQITAREFGVNELFAFEQRELLVKCINNGDIQARDDNTKLSLLAIEDNPDTQQLVSRILRNRFEVKIAANGEDGLNLWRQMRPSIVLLDVMLPGMSGNQVLSEIMRENPSQSVVIMTANHTIELAEELMLKGAADFVTKPFRAEQLRRACETAARREDFMISNHQFAAKVDSLAKSREEYKSVLEAHQHLLDHLGSVVIEIDQNGDIKFLNQAWEKLTGYSIDESQDKPFADFMETPEVSGLHISNEFQSLLQGKTHSHRFEFRLKNNFDEELWVEARFEININKDNKDRIISGTIDNVTTRKKAQRDLEYLAMHDGLTGLFNRHYFETELKQFTATAARGNGPHSLLYIDLDHFKVINDTLGHHHGDSVLRNISSLIASRMRDSDILSRIGGDEFALLLPNTDQNLALKIADDICELLHNYQCKLENQIFQVNCSIGISEISGNEQSPEEYMKQADIALYAAKRQGRNLAHLFDANDVHSKDMQASLEWSRKLHQAVADDNLELYFQPVVSIESRKVEYYEALVRLKLDGKVVSPVEFIPALEREGDMSLLDHQVINKATRYLRDTPQLKKIAINLSAQGFSDERLVPLIQEKIEENQIEANRIIFELTESASLSNIEATKTIVSKIRKLGCEFSIDDFGTGFSTFTYLKQLPAQSVKIDGSFVVDLASNPVDLALVKAIYEVATALNKKTVAEFVENEETLNLLKKIGVTYAQGYHLGKPLPIKEIFVKSHLENNLTFKPKLKIPSNL